MRSLRHLVIGAALLAPACGTCGAEPEQGTSEPQPAATAPAEAHSDGVRELFRAADARRLTDGLREGLRDSDPAVRRAAALAVSRLHDPAAVPVLVQALRDPAPEVRRNASLGLGALEDEAPAGVPQALLAALAAEEVVDNRAAILWDLSRVAGEEGLPALREGMAANEPQIRAAACRGLGFYGLRSRALEPALLRRIAARMVDDADPAVRLACSYALTRLAPPVDSATESGAIVEDLGRALEEQDADVRGMAVRALGRYPGAPLDAIAARTADADWQVAVQAFRALGRGGPSAETAYARALRARLDRALAHSGELHGPELHVLLAAFEGAAPFARGSAVHGVATEALARIARIDGDADRDRGLAHCAAAALVDRGRGWPTRLQDGCGMGLVSETERQVAMAEVLRDLEGAQAERLALLQRLYREGDLRVRQSVLAASGSLDAISVAELVLEGLASEDAGVVTTALDTLAAIAPKWRVEAPAAAAPVLSVRPAGAPAPEAEPTGPAAPTPARVEAALRRAWEVLRAADEVEGLQSWARAVVATESRALQTELGSLALHPVAGVRRSARGALEDLGAAVPEGEIPAPANVIELESLPASRAFRAVVTTTRGEIELELLPAEAPTTVARFVALARDGFFDGVAFHRVVPAFVVQGGDPRGDGYGGPGWTQRCEDNRLAYRRGTVGMALAGRDTGGSQFFIAHGPQPHLDGRYTAFGRVVRGMEIVDALQVGDQIRSVDVAEGHVETGDEG